MLLLNDHRDWEPRILIKTLANSVPEDDDAASESANDETPGQMTAPGVSEQTEKLVTWDEPPGAAGRQMPVVKPEDDNSAAEQLVKEGSEEAERDRRIAATKANFET